MVVTTMKLQETKDHVLYMLDMAKIPKYVKPRAAALHILPRKAAGRLPLTLLNWKWYLNFINLNGL